ncbi:GGDEF domain-containing protein [Nocardioides panacisoli]|uniref:GGDEF domain-containing protein n=1 Tax=Nocardioides panacisoli TaxID=627624 RepID=A0ABP7IXJ4_9ACTN
MEPRDHRAAGRNVLLLCCVAAAATVVLSPWLPADNRLGPDAVVAGTGILGLVVLLSVLARVSSRVNVLAWALCPLLAVVALVVLDLLTHDATVDAQIFFVFPVLYGASQLRPPGSAVMTGSALLGELVVAAQLPFTQTVAETGYVAAVLVTVSVMLTISTRRNARLIEHLERMAAVDPLTGLVTRRVFDEAAASAITGSANEEGTSLVLLDVDNFKAINDRYGHPGGDEVLVQLARLLLADMRRGDVVCRLGGDEIAVLMPGCSREDARLRAEQKLAEVRSHVFRLAGAEAVHVSVSIGLAHAPTDAEDVRTLYTRADAALYRAKAGGRGRVALAA